MIDLKQLHEAMPRDVQRKMSLHDLKRTVDAYNKADVWQPMENSPRDGSVFLAFAPHIQVGYAFVAVWNTENRLLCMMSGRDCTDEATRWRPLPEFPVSRCDTCDGTGDVHRFDGEWLGSCPHCHSENDQGEARADSATSPHDQTL